MWLPIFCSTCGAQGSPSEFIAGYFDPAFSQECFCRNSGVDRSCQGAFQYHGFVALLLWCCLYAFGCDLHGPALQGSPNGEFRGTPYVSSLAYHYVATLSDCGVGRLISDADQKLSVRSVVRFLPCACALFGSDVVSKRRTRATTLDLHLLSTEL